MKLMVCVCSVLHQMIQIYSIYYEVHNLNIRKSPYYFLCMFQSFVLYSISQISPCPSAETTGNTTCSIYTVHVANPLYMITHIYTFHLA